MKKDSKRNIPAMLGKTTLFHGLTEDEIAEALDIMRAHTRSYEKGDIILHAGSTTENVSFVLDGSVILENNDIWGNRSILGLVSVSGFFGEVYAMLPGEPLLIDASANEATEILFMNIREIMENIIPHSSWQLKFIRNLMMISVHKNLKLSSRAFHTAPKTVRGRVMAYLNTVSLRAGSQSFTIPFDRQQMADYLSVDRTALSKELGRMKKDGILDFNRSHFTIKKK